MNPETYPKTYAIPIKVLSPDSSIDRLIKPSSVMKYFQEISDCHCTAVGNDYQTLKNQNMGRPCPLRNMAPRNEGNPMDSRLCDENSAR